MINIEFVQNELYNQFCGFQFKMLISLFITNINFIQVKVFFDKISSSAFYNKVTQRGLLEAFLVIQRHTA